MDGDFSVLNIIPHGEIYSDDDEKAGSMRERAKTRVKFLWVSGNGEQLAPDTKLILNTHGISRKKRGVLGEATQQIQGVRSAYLSVKKFE